MNCKKCNSVLNETDKFCKECGTMVENSNVDTNNQYSNVSTYKNTEVNDGQNIIQNQNLDSVQINSQNTISSNNQITEQQPIKQVQPNMNYSNNDNINKSVNTSKKGLISMVLGIVSIGMALVLNIFIIPVALVGLILGLMEKTKNSKKTVGIVLNSIALILSIIISVIGGLSLIDDFTSDSIFYGDGYQLTYDNDWVRGTISEKKALSYSDADNSYFLPIGKSALSEFSCDFENITCKTKIYNEFYDMWNKSLNQNSLYLYKESYSFKTLKDDIYYGTYNYGKSITDLRGKYYLLISKEKNIILSFMTNSNANDLEEISEEVLELFKTIEIEKNTSVNNSNSNSNSDENTIYDDELYGMLDSMSNWNKYSNLRTGNLGKVSYITGGWRILSDSDAYWEFKNGEFYWYKSVNDLNDNYWYGTTKILTGKEALKSVGLDESKVDNIVSHSNGRVTANDIYAIVCTPTKIISGGEDKSATNIPANSKWNYVWVVVDHGDEGIEAQVVNVDSAKTTYYVKIKD
ncbi:MAG: hypothetical protein PUD59_05805 [bacterium]|nr:hypothetical protein [bacterium]